MNCPPPGTKLAAILSAAFAVSFMVLFFTPFDLYLHNPTGFIVGWKFLLPSLIALILPAFVGLSTVLLLLYHRKTVAGAALFALCAAVIAYLRFVRHHFLYVGIPALLLLAALLAVWVLSIKFMKEKAVDAALLLIWGVVTAAYVQSLFLNGEMVQLTGDRAGYGDVTAGHVANLLLWVAIMSAPLCVWLFLGRKKKAFNFDKPLIFTLLLVCGMQAAGLISAAVSADLPVGYEDNPRYLSYGNTLSFNKDKNIAVFVLDRLDVSYMTDALDNYPELYEMLDGFTFYKNNVSEFGGTFPSVPTMLTQYYYDDSGLTFSEYWRTAWSRHNVIDTLRENGYTTNLLIDKLSTYGSYDEIDRRTDNIELAKKLEINPKGMINAMGKLAFGRLAPYFMKNLFLATVNPSFGNWLYDIGDIDGHASVGSASDRKFYEYIKSETMSADSQKPVSNFIHLNCAHVDRDKTIRSMGYHWDSEKQTIVGFGNYVETTAACFYILDEYFSKMKQAGVYDNTTIILLGDHGRDLDTESENPAVATGLLIKPQKASGVLKIDTASELSNRYLPASILEAAGIPHDNLGLSYNDVIMSEEYPVRRYYVYNSWWDARGRSESIRLSGMYEISGDANNFSNWKFVSNE
jgi:hypothetical protein